MPINISAKLALPVWIAVGAAGLLLGRRGAEPKDSENSSPPIPVRIVDTPTKIEEPLPESSARARSLIASGDFGSRELRQAITVWARTDVEAASRFIIEEVPRNKQSSLFKWGITFPFALAAPELVIRSAFATGDEDRAEEIIKEFANFASSGKIKSILEDLEKFPEGELEKDTRNRMLKAWRKLDFDAARQWVSGISEDELRREMIAQLVRGTDAKDAKKSAEFILSLQGEEQQKAIYAFGGDVEFHEPELVMDIRAKYEDGDLSLGFIGAGIAVNDPDYAISLAHRMPPGKKRRRVFADIAKYWARSEPVPAAEWAASIPNPKDREAALNQLQEK